MKSIVKPLIAFFIIISMSTTSKAQLPPDFEILNTQFLRLFTPLILTKNDGLVQIDSGYKIKTILQDSTVGDSLIIHLFLPKIRIKSLSFSRHDTAYCYVNKYPLSDSLKWGLLPLSGWINDTLKLQDSILELELGSRSNNPPMYVIWHLKKKYTFNIGDTFSLVLAEIPDRPPLVKTLPQNEYMLKSGNSRESRIFILMDGYPHGSREEQTNIPVFDISGKRQISIAKKSGIFVMPPAPR